MRYESFYPFARNQSPPTRPQRFGANPFPEQIQNPGQWPRFGMANNPHIDPRSVSPIPGNPSAPGLSKVDGYMQTANRFLNTAQQFAPVVQQFAPMMKNLPAMWKLYKGFQSIPAAGQTAGAAGAVANTFNRAASGAGGLAAATAATTGPQPSIPKIFQPPGL